MASAAIHRRMVVAAPGYFGKVPSHGDFLSRRVPAGMAEIWDQWLASLTTAVRAGAGEAWPEAWLTAPIWHFALGAKLAPGDGAAGLLIASVDRVGRMFPFTIIGPCAGTPAPAWSDAIEALALGALDDDFSPDTLDRALQAVGPAPVTEPLPSDASLWWCRGSDRISPMRVQHAGMPNAKACAAMVLGESVNNGARTHPTQA